KRRVELPSRIVGILRCMNPNCVTNVPRESVKPTFTLLSRDPLRMVCEYCGEYLTEEEVVEQLSGV
ncbi:MAG: aspartate carbamoyltransferase regulatory subunit, partial [Candidatus Korarchaeum sp.]